jgi:hypothetical protein
MYNPQQNEDLLITPKKTPEKEANKTPSNSKRKDGTSSNRDSNEKKSDTSENKISKNLDTTEKIDENADNNEEINDENITTRTDRSDADCMKSFYTGSKSEKTKKKLDIFNKQNSNKNSSERNGNISEHDKIGENSNELPVLLNEVRDDTRDLTTQGENDELLNIGNEWTEAKVRLESLIEEINNHLTDHPEIKNQDTADSISGMNTMLANLPSSKNMNQIGLIGFGPKIYEEPSIFSARYWVSRTERSDKQREQLAKNKFKELQQKFDQQVSAIRELADKEAEVLEAIKLYSDKNMPNEQYPHLKLNLEDLESKIHNNNSAFNTGRSQDSKNGNKMDKIIEESQSDDASYYGRFKSGASHYSKIVIDPVNKFGGKIYNEAFSYMPWTTKKLETSEAINEKQQAQEEYKEQQDTENTNADTLKTEKVDNSLGDQNLSNNQERDTATVYHSPYLGEIIKYGGYVMLAYMIYLANEGFNDTTYNSHFDL